MYCFKEDFQYNNFYKTRKLIKIMKAESWELNAKVNITPEELLELEKASLEGILVFTDRNESGWRIKLTLSHDLDQEEQLEVDQHPNTGYFMYASHVQFSLNQEAYNTLRENLFFEHKFYDDSGNLKLRVE